MTNNGLANQNLNRNGNTVVANGEIGVGNTVTVPVDVDNQIPVGPEGGLEMDQNLGPQVSHNFVNTLNTGLIGTLGTSHPGSIQINHQSLSMHQSPTYDSRSLPPVGESDPLEGSGSDPLNVSFPGNFHSDISNHRLKVTSSSSNLQ